jgi:peptidoglycan/LPS O-acetylase OafA/YrhL
VESRVWRVVPWVVGASMLVLMVMADNRGWSPWTTGLPLTVAGIVAASMMRGDDLASFRAWWRTRRAKVATLALVVSAITAIITSVPESDPMGAIYGTTMLVALVIFAVRGSSRGALFES